MTTRFTVRPQFVPVDQADDRHPGWCARGHHCTPAGRIVATRYRRGDGTRDRVEVRAVVELDPADDAAARQRARVAVAAVYEALARRAGPPSAQGGEA